MEYPGAFTNSGFAGKEVGPHSLLLTALLGAIGVFSCIYYQTDWFHVNNTSSCFKRP
jgi:hypothetical protein